MEVPTQSRGSATARWPLVVATASGRLGSSDPSGGAVPPRSSSVATASGRLGSSDRPVPRSSRVPRGVATASGRLGSSDVGSPANRSPPAAGRNGIGTPWKFRRGVDVDREVELTTSQRHRDALEVPTRAYAASLCPFVGEVATASGRLGSSDSHISRRVSISWRSRNGIGTPWKFRHDRDGRRVGRVLRVATASGRLGSSDMVRMPRVLSKCRVATASGRLGSSDDYQHTVPLARDQVATASGRLGSSDRKSCLAGGHRRRESRNGIGTP